MSTIYYKRRDGSELQIEIDGSGDWEAWTDKGEAADLSSSEEIEIGNRVAAFRINHAGDERGAQ
jgi:hypothetical protein